MRDDAPLAPDAAVAAAERPDGARARGTQKAAGLGVLLAFTATTFLSAVLLFSVQPMFAKMVLPLLGRRAVGVGGGAALLSGGTARRLRLRASSHPQGAAPRDGLCSSRARGHGASCAADRPPCGLDRAAAGGRLFLAARPVHGGDRAAVCRGCCQCSALAGLVRAHRTPAGRRSLLSLRGVELGKPARASRLSLRPRAGVRSQGARQSLDRRVRRAACCARHLLLAGAARRRRRRGRRARRGGRMRPARRPIGTNARPGSVSRSCRRRCSRLSRRTSRPTWRRRRSSG